MPEESYSFAQARVRLEEIVGQVRKKDTSLEKSLDLLEEGVRLANQCTELIDHADWEAAGSPGAQSPVEASEEQTQAADLTRADEAADAEEDAEPEAQVPADADAE